MIHYKVYIKEYDWCIECFITTDNTLLNKIMCKLEKLGCSDKILTKAYHILSNQLNSGFAYSNQNKSIMVINMSTSMDEFINTYNHEKNHIEMHICEELGIDPYSEKAADLSGLISLHLYFAMIEQLA